jgi:uncharacterized repeat protein (TIGR01451 family)
MRTRLDCKAWIIAALPVVLAGQPSAVLYVAPNGSDSNSGSVAMPFRTIQHAIDLATGGSAVVVLEGRYVGPGNVDLHFDGKAIVVQSRNPSDPNCVRATVIDAEGKGAIAHFTHGEGPATVLAGFTLLPGERTPSGRGSPGYFEIAADAHPATRNLRVPPAAVAAPKAELRIAPRMVESGTPTGTRAWDGNNPFLRPAAATDYYGSGDVDGDGQLTPADLQLVQQMVSGQVPPTATADVDGNGVVDSADVALITAALAGGTLPAWWNQLTTRDQRNAWIDKFLALDPTNYHPPGYWFQCLNYAVQVFLNGGLYRNDLFGEVYDGGRSRFNLPLYVVDIDGNGFGHSIDAILVGDNPLNFGDWRFLEPQTDDSVYPGLWDMPFGTQVTIHAPNMIVNSGYSSDEDKVVFSIDDTGKWSLISWSPNLVIARPVPPAVTPDNRPDLWNPVVLPVSGGMLLFNQRRNDLLRTDDIHVTNLPFNDPPSAQPLVLDTEYARLLDFTVGPGGTVHLLWTGGASFSPGLFYGVFDVATRSLKTVSRITPGTREVHWGRIVVTPSGEVHAFWFVQASNTLADYTNGVYWSRWTGSAWAAEQNIGPFGARVSDWGDWQLLEPFHSIFDAVAMPDGTILVVWCARDNSDITLRQRRYSGSWAAPVDIETTAWQGGGVDLVSDSQGTVHALYWYGNWPNPYVHQDSYGNLFHRTFTGTSWSAPATVDAGGQAAAPFMVAANGTVYAVWMRDTNSQIVPVLKKYAGSQWSSEQVFTVRPGADAYYPSLGVLPDGRLVVAWSSRSADRVTVETTTNPVVALRIVETPVGTFMQGQDDATYTVTVSNQTDAGTSFGTVTVTETVPTGMTLVSMAGTGWTCPAGGATCTRSDTLNGGTGYPAIAVTLKVAANAASQVTNLVSLSGGGSANASASNVASISPFSCDFSGDQATNVVNVQLVIDEALGVIPAVHDLNHDGVVNMADVQKAINAALGLGCPY